MGWKLTDAKIQGAAWRPFMAIRQLTDKELSESQMAAGMFALHNPDAGLPCISCRTYNKLGAAATTLDQKVKKDGEAVIACESCNSIHALVPKTKDQGWVVLARPL